MTTRRPDKRLPRRINWVAVYYLSVTGFLLLFFAVVAQGGTLFDENGDKVDVCKGSTCQTGSGNGGNDGGTAPAPGTTVNNTLTASPSSKSSAKATSSAKSVSTSRSQSSSSANATGGKSSARASGGRATATGGSSNATTGNATATNGNQTTSVTVQSGNTGGADLSKMVPDVYSPGLTTGGDDVCLGSVSGGLGLSGLGAMLGWTTVDEHCQTIKAVKLLRSIGRNGAAIRRACMDEKMREALGDECPEVATTERRPSSSSSFTH